MVLSVISPFSYMGGVWKRTAYVQRRRDGRRDGHGWHHVGGCTPPGGGFAVELARASWGHGFCLRIARSFPMSSWVRAAEVSCGHGGSRAASLVAHRTQSCSDRLGAPRAVLPAALGPRRGPCRRTGYRNRRLCSCHCLSGQGDHAVRAPRGARTRSVVRLVAAVHCAVRIGVLLDEPGGRVQLHVTPVAHRCPVLHGDDLLDGRFRGHHRQDRVRSPDRHGSDRLGPHHHRPRSPSHPRGRAAQPGTWHTADAG